MSTIFEEFNAMTCKEIMENLHKSETMEEQQFYAGLFNIKSKIAFKEKENE